MSLRINHFALTQRLSELEAKVLDPILFGQRWNPETGQMEDTGPGAGTVVGGAAVGAGVAGAYLGHRAIMSKYGANGLANGIGAAYKAAGSAGLATAKTAGADVLAAGGKLGAQAVDATVNATKAGASRVGKFAGEAWNRLKGLRLESGNGLAERLVNLEAKLDESLEFDVMPWLVGNPTTAAVGARKGKKWDAWKEAHGNVMVDQSIGGAAGALGGAAIGAGLTKVPAIRKSLTIKTSAVPGGRMRRGSFRKTPVGAIGALGGALAGTVIGSAVGGIHGHVSAKAKEIRERYR